MNWEEKLNIFLNDYKYKDDLIGVLVCGSYITGSPNNHSDLDVHLILREEVDYRVRGNKIIDGLLIEYFSNSPNQIRKYFNEHYKQIRPMSQTQFITGRIVMDKHGEVKKLKEEAIEMMLKKFIDVDTSLNELQKYGLWDMLDDLESIYESNREDFNFIYYCNLDKLLSIYIKSTKQKYDKKTMLGHIDNIKVREKYLLDELPDKDIKESIKKCITSKDRKEMLDNYRIITNKLFDLNGGFEIDGFEFKSNKDID